MQSFAYVSKPDSGARIPCFSAAVLGQRRLFEGDAVLNWLLTIYYKFPEIPIGM